MVLHFSLSLSTPCPVTITLFSIQRMYRGHDLFGELPAVNDGRQLVQADG